MRIVAGRQGRSSSVGCIVTCTNTSTNEKRGKSLNSISWRLFRNRALYYFSRWFTVLLWATTKFLLIFFLLNPTGDRFSLSNLFIYVRRQRNVYDRVLHRDTLHSNTCFSRVNSDKSFSLIRSSGPTLQDGSVASLLYCHRITSYTPRSFRSNTSPRPYYYRVVTPLLVAGRR